jgi:hypothetical protein
MSCKRVFSAILLLQITNVLVVHASHGVDAPARQLAEACSKNFNFADCAVGEEPMPGDPLCDGPPTGRACNRDICCAKKMSPSARASSFAAQEQPQKLYDSKAHEDEQLNKDHVVTDIRLNRLGRNCVVFVLVAGVLTFFLAARYGRQAFEFGESNGFEPLQADPDFCEEDPSCDENLQMVTMASMEIGDPGTSLFIPKASKDISVHSKDPEEIGDPEISLFIPKAQAQDIDLEEVSMKSLSPCVSQKSLAPCVSSRGYARSPLL